MTVEKRILVTGAGGAATPHLIEHMRGLGMYVVAADADAEAAGLLLADKGYVIPFANTPAFLPAIRRICAAERINAVVPLVDEELLQCCDLREAGIFVLAPTADFIATCLDKLALMERLRGAGIAVPAGVCGDQAFAGLRFPLIAKPRTGRGSRGVRMLARAEEAHAYLADAAPAGILIQEFVDGVEYTVSVVVSPAGEVHAVVPKRIIAKRGITRLAATERNPAIEQVCVAVQQALRADGPFNVQLKVDAKSGVPMIFEINPRFSTTVTLTMASGIDEVAGLLIQGLDGPGTYRFGAWQSDVVLVRRGQDAFMSGADYLARSRHIMQA
jgi:carbamoyl-phosphate synthase large subunit